MSNLQQICNVKIVATLLLSFLRGALRRNISNLQHENCRGLAFIPSPWCLEEGNIKFAT